jgi:hypothetical protein
MKKMKNILQQFLATSRQKLKSWCHVLVGDVLWLAMRYFLVFDAQKT